MQRLCNARIFDGDRVHDEASLLIDNGKIVAIVPANDVTPDGASEIDLANGLLAPGLIDIQVNGGGGVLFNDAPELDSLVTIADAHRQYGTTAFLPTLITCDTDTMEAAIAAVNAAMEAAVPGVVGLHLEGPYLSPEYSGIHDASQIRTIDDSVQALLAKSVAGRLMLTVAPEEVSESIIRKLVASGYVVFAGHSASSYEQVSGALTAGVSGFTHLFNAMTQMMGRNPGMVGAALDDEDSYIGIIADGYHVHPASLRVAIAAKKKGKVILVTDAMPTVGSDTTEFLFGGETMHAEGGRCLTMDGALAGTNIGMIDAVRNAAELGGVDQFEALRMASAYPAAAIQLDKQMGYIRPGYRANLIELDDALRVKRSWIDGEMREYRGGNSWT